MYLCRSQIVNRTYGLVHSKTELTKRQNNSCHVTILETLKHYFHGLFFFSNRVVTEHKALWSFVDTINNNLIQNNIFI